MSQGARPGPGRALVSLWVLVAVAVAASGALVSSLAAAASPAAGLGVALSGTVLAVSLALAARVMAALERARPHRTSFGRTWREFLQARRSRQPARTAGPRPGAQGRGALRSGVVPSIRAKGSPDGEGPSERRMPSPSS